jgi:hypothetical protein
MRTLEQVQEFSLVHKISRQSRNRREQAGGTEQVADLGLMQIALTYSVLLNRAVLSLGGEIRCEIKAVYMSKYLTCHWRAIID